MAMYVDDLGRASIGNMSVLTEIENDLATILGLIFKQAKDVHAVRHMKYIGFELETNDSVVRAAVPAEFIAELMTLLEGIIANDGVVSVGQLEKVLGKA